MTDTSTRPNGPVPDGEGYRLGNKGGKLALAIQEVWDNLSPAEYRDPLPLVLNAAETYDLKPISIRSYLFKMAADGRLSGMSKSTDRLVHRFGKEYVRPIMCTQYKIVKREDA